ncbi:PAS domain-containing protein [Anatilimnocola floriformis]|uniref:PAS domain-containing protein n=1 Tax=Anatilimnocola floriformis TaxID=2948575 RepID=UPI0020C53CCB|nr:PAS domain-containing protein [Anatilimnocola floriformis]
MFEEAGFIGIWECDPASERDWVDVALQEFLQAVPVVRGEKKPISLLSVLSAADCSRLLAAARLAVESRAPLAEEFELNGTASAVWRIRLQGGVLPSGQAGRVVASCRCESKPAEPSSEEELRKFMTNDLVDSIPLFIVILNHAGDLHYVNRRTAEFLGWSLKELQEKDWVTEFLEPSEQARIQTAMANSYLAKGMETVQTRIRSATGEIRILEWNGCSAFQPGNNSGWMVGVGLDVTERENAEQASRLKQRALEQSINGIVISDMQARLTFVNESFQQMLGYDSPTEMLGMFALDLCEDPAAGARVMETVLANDAWVGELNFVRKDRNLIVLLVSATLLRDQDGQPQSLMASTIDITERKRHMRERLQIQEALQASEQHYRQLFETMTEGFSLHELIVNDQGEPIDYRYLDVNPAFETLMNVRRADVIGKLHSEFPSDDREFWVKTYGQVALTGQPLRSEYVHPKTQRQWIVLAYRTQPLQFAVLFSEISNWREAEQERQIAHDRLMMIINKAPLILFSLDRDGCVTASEGRGLARVGLRPGQLVGKTIAEVYPAATPSLRAIERALSGESVNFLAEGQGVFFDSHYEPIHDIDGKVIGMTGLAVDMTEQTQAQARLRESSERLQLLLKYAPAGVAMFDRDLKYIACSLRWLVDYRLEGQDLLGRSHYEVFPEITPRWREIHNRCLQGAVERCERDMFKRADGTATWLRWEIQPWRDAEGNIGGLVFFTEDVSKDVQAEEEVQSLRNQAAHAGRIATMGEMAAGIAHELNQPLAAISLYAEGCAAAANAGALSQPDLIEKFSQIGELANRCGEIIRRLRAFATKRESRRSTQDLRDILAASLELLRHEYRNAGVQCRVAMPEDPLWLFADTIELQQVFINILRNALEATVAQVGGLWRLPRRQFRRLIAAFRSVTTGREFHPPKSLNSSLLSSPPRPTASEWD